MVAFCSSMVIVCSVLFFIALVTGLILDNFDVPDVVIYLLFFCVIFFAVTTLGFMIAGAVFDSDAANKLRAADDLYKTIHSGLSKQPDIDNARLTVLLDDIQTDLYRRGEKSDYYKYIDNYPWLGLKV